MTSTLNWTIPEDVHAFAEEAGVAAYLLPMLEATDRVFPNARRRAVVVTEDPEIAYDRHIVFEVEVDIPEGEYLSSRGRWLDLTSKCCPTTLICVFRLSLEVPD